MKNTSHFPLFRNNFPLAIFLISVILVAQNSFQRFSFFSNTWGDRVYFSSEYSVHGRRPTQAPHIDFPPLSHGLFCRLAADFTSV